MGVEVLLGSSSFAGCYSIKLVMGTAETLLNAMHGPFGFLLCF